MPTPFALVLTTCGGEDEAESIATQLVEQCLSACVQKFPVESVYRWEGEVQRAEEWMLFCKIKASDYEKVEAAIRAAHSYSNPEIIEVAIENGSNAYLAWVAASTSRA
ncbi:MAG: divalent-cation tolerance protein CutA [Beijerinckiaceae bacterium]|nr:divalent-cation tolerance protein CutA [Beijerinckiaceae bacterium]MCI0735974.1 divalent-cation tolerance protein CutA [Beijerinckiaceae bacterium]